MRQRGNSSGVAAWLVSLALGCVLQVASAVGGKPLMTRFRPDLDVFPQFFGVAQGADGLLYLGTAELLLRYDGVRWESIALPVRGPVRSLLLDARGRLWIGASNCIGYLVRDANGEDRYVDLTAQFAAQVGKEGFSDIWDMAEHRGHVFFRSLHWLLEVDADGKRVHEWNAPGRFGGIAVHDGEMVVQWRGEGLKRLVGDRFELLPGGEQFAAKPAFVLLSLDAHRLVVQDQTPRIALLQDGVARVLRQDAELTHLTVGMALDANTVAYGGDDGVMRVYNVQDDTLQQVRVGASFIDGMARDRDGALLLASDEGATRLPWPAPWTVFGPDDGLLGSIHDAQVIDGSLRLQTGAGEYVAAWSDNGPTPPFVAQRSSAGEAWTLFADGTTRLLADSYGLMQLDGTPHRIGGDDLYPRSIERSPFDAGVVWIGTESGMAELVRDGANWRIRARHNDLGLRATTLVETAPGELWLGSEDRGVVQLKLRVADGGIERQRRIDGDAGLSYGDGPEATVSQVDGDLVIGTRAGLFRRTGEGFQRDALGGLAALLQKDEVLTFRDAGAHGVWAWSYRAVYRRVPGQGWSAVNGVRPGSSAIETVRPLSGGDALIAGGHHLVYYDAGVPVPPQTDPPLRIAELRLVTRRGDERRLDPSRTVETQYAEGTLVFDLGLPDLTQNTPPQFQVRVEGVNDAWSGWSQRASFSYAELPPGEYRFEARARTGAGRVLPAVGVNLVVVPRWYQRGLVHIFAGLLLLVLLPAVLTARHRVRLRRLRARNVSLDGLVRARTTELELANRQLRDLAERDGLTGVANRRRFDAALATETAAAAAAQRPLAVLIVDVDRFKEYNDAHGHLAGDEMLKQVAGALAACVRGDTLVARFGGEEFCLIAPNCDLPQALLLAERLRGAVVDACPGITISLGVATGVPRGPADAEGLLSRADTALYRAKNGGRNRVESEPLPAAGE